MVDPLKRWVLVVEDDEAVREALVSLIRAEPDLAAVGACSGGEALRILGAMRVHLLLVDLMMPGLDGLAFARAARALDATRDLPVVVVTAQPPDAALRRAAEADYAVLAKPFSRSDLLGVIRLVLAAGDAESDDGADESR